MIKFGSVFLILIDRSGISKIRYLKYLVEFIIIYNTKKLGEVNVTYRLTVVKFQIKITRYF